MVKTVFSHEIWNLAAFVLAFKYMSIVKDNSILLVFETILISFLLGNHSEHLVNDICLIHSIAYTIQTRKNFGIK